MSWLAWHNDTPHGPECGLCGAPLRLDSPVAHECDREDRKLQFAWVEHLFAAAVVLALILFAYAVVSSVTDVGVR